MKKIFTLLFVLISFLGQAQNEQNDIKILQDKINQFEKSGDTLNEQYPVLFKDLGYLYQKQKKYENAEALFLKALKITKKSRQKKPLYYSASCYNLAQLYQIQEKYSKAEPLYLKALEIIEKNSDTNSFIYSVILNNLGALYHYQHKYSDSEHFYLKAIGLAKQHSQTNTRNYAFLLKNLARLYEGQGKFIEAEDYFFKSIKIEKETLGEKDLIYAESLNYIGEFYSLNKKHNEAKPLYLKSLEIRKEILGEKHIDYATSLNNLGAVYSELGRYSEAEVLLKEALVIRLEVLGENHEYYLRSLENLAINYSKQGKYSEAESLFIQIVEIKKNIFGAQNISNLRILYNLGSLYNDIGNYYKAEPLFLKILENSKDILEVNNSFYMDVLNKLGQVYRYQGRYSDAENFFLKAFEIQKEILGENNLDYVTSLNNLASIYDSQNKYIEAEIFYLKALKIYKEILGDRKPDNDYSIYINNLAQLYDHQGKYSKSVPLHLEALKIKKETLGEGNPSYAISLKNLALSYREQGKYDEVEPLFLKSLKIKKEIFGEKHPSYIVNLLNLAVFYRIIKSNEKSSTYFEKFTRANQKRIIDDVVNMSEKDLITYVNFKKEELFSPLSFLYDLPTQYPVINVSSFENELLLKNLSLRNQERIKISIQKNGVKSLQDKYQQFVANKKEIKKLQELPLDKQPANFLEFTTETEKIEKELAQESALFSEYEKAMSISFNNVKNKLKKNEIVIDLVSFRYYKKRASDSIIYAAFVIGKDFKAPKFIPIFEQKQLEFLLARNEAQSDSIRIAKQYLDKSISDLFLKPLEEELQGIKTIYLSPTGLGHQIDFAALPISESQTLGEIYKVHILSSPAEIVDYKVSILDKKSNIELLLYGGIDYDKSNAKTEIKKEIIDANDDVANLVTRSGIKNFGYLKGTNHEIEQIKFKGTQNGFATTIFNEREATEESIKQLDGKIAPFVLHLATHGFFFPDPIKEIQKDIFSEQGKSKIYKASDDPMLRSGLLFAGANNYWGKSTENNTTDDGILTAAEISNLDLGACQLVVLSACETGLGEINGSEGVFGLQRAFKMAGVKNIIMSLWKVPDTQTAELFDIFYTECFAGKSIHEAFQSAQSKMKAKYSPYYWAGFVLLE